PAAAAEALTLLLHPFAPHLAEEMWETLGHPPSVQAAPWPTFDPSKCVDAEVEIAVQVLGKVRGRITLARDASEAVALEAAKALPAIASQLEGKTIRKVVYVPAKILNFIVG